MLRMGLLENIQIVDVPVALDATLQRKKEHAKVIPFVEAAQQPFRQAIFQMAEEAGGVDWLISSSLLHFVGSIAQDIGAQWLSVWTLGPLAAALCRGFEYVNSNPIPPGWLDTQLIEIQELDFCANLPPEMRVRDIPIGIRAGHGFLNEVVHSMGHARAVLMDTFKILNSDVIDWFKSEVNPHTYCVGPLKIDATSLPHELQTLEGWLDRCGDKKVVVIEIGEELTTKELEDLSKALIEEDIPYLWAIHPHAFNRAQELTRSDNLRAGLLQNFLPWDVVLRHAKTRLFVASGGCWSSMMTSISVGVPMICRPSSTVGLLNSYVMSTCWKVGWEIKKIPTKDETKALLYNALNPDYLENHQLLNAATMCMDLADADNSHTLEWNTLTSILLSGS